MEDDQKHPCTLHEALLARVEASPDAVALVYGELSLTFGEFQGRVNEVALTLRQLGVARGDSVAMVGQNCPEFLYCCFACATLGAVFVPVNANLTAPEIGYIVEHSAAKWLFHDDVIAAAAQAPAVQDKCRPISHLERRVVGDLDHSAEPVLADSDLLIAYTSGSTGTPKAVVLDHASQLGAARSMASLWALGPGDVSVVAAPLGFLLGLSTASLIALINGATVVLNRRFHPKEVLETLTQHGATVFHGVPTMYSMMLEYSEQNDRLFDLSGVRALVCSGAPMPAEMAARFRTRFGRAPQNYFGMTECYPLAATYASDPSAVPAGAVGRLAPGASVRFVDAEGRECAQGSAGEMLARGPSMLKRYHKALELTASSLVDGWFRTGDIGHQDDDGFVYITGRLKDLIIRGGANIAPAEVENVLMRHPAVASAAVIGVPDEIFGEVPVAYVVPRGGAELEAADLIEFAISELASFKVPSQVVLRDQLPLGSTGKVDKTALRAAWKAENTR